MKDAVLLRIRRAVIAGRYVVTEKARREMDGDGLDPSDIVEAIVTAVRIQKSIRSRQADTFMRGDRLHVIVNCNLSGVPIYTKGRLSADSSDRSVFVLISAKRAR